MNGAAFGLTPARWENTDECPDCRADVELTEQHPGVWCLQVQHDNTCPWLANYQRKVAR